MTNKHLWNHLSEILTESVAIDKKYLSSLSLNWLLPRDSCRVGSKFIQLGQIKSCIISFKNNFKDDIEPRVSFAWLAYFSFVCVGESYINY